MKLTKSCWDLFCNRALSIPTHRSMNCYSLLFSCFSSWAKVSEQRVHKSSSCWLQKGWITPCFPAQAHWFEHDRTSPALQFHRTTEHLLFVTSWWNWPMGWKVGGAQKTDTPLLCENPTTPQVALSRFLFFSSSLLQSSLEAWWTTPEDKFKLLLQLLVPCWVQFRSSH